MPLTSYARPETRVRRRRAPPLAPLGFGRLEDLNARPPWAEPRPTDYQPRRLHYTDDVSPSASTNAVDPRSRRNELFDYLNDPDLADGGWWRFEQPRRRDAT